ADVVAPRPTRPAHQSSDSGLAWGQSALADVDLDRVGAGHGHRHIHEHLAATRADVLEEGQARMTDGVGHGAAGRLRRVVAMDVHAHAELEDISPCAHGPPPIASSADNPGGSRMVHQDVTD